MLKKKDLDIIIAENGDEAIRFYDKFSFDLIIMDINMPIIDGYDATLMIRDKEAESGKHTPIIAMTAYALTGDEERIIAAGVDDYISKPINFNKFSELLDKYLE